jgi:hypothetical protein
MTPLTLTDQIDQSACIFSVQEVSLQENRPPDHPTYTFRDRVHMLAKG